VTPAQWLDKIARTHMRLAIAALLTLAALPARAQSPWADMPVPTAALTLLQVPLEAARPLAMLRAIRVRQSIEIERDALPPPLLPDRDPSGQGRLQDPRSPVLHCTQVAFLRL